MVLNDPSIRGRIRQSATLRLEGGISTLAFHAMGTRCRVLLAGGSRAAAESYLDHLLVWVADFEATYSRFLEGS